MTQAGGAGNSKLEIRNKFKKNEISKMEKKGFGKFRRRPRTSRAIAALQDRAAAETDRGTSRGPRKADPFRALFAGDQRREAADFAQPFGDSAPEGHGVERRPAKEATEQAQLAAEIVAFRTCGQGLPRLKIDSSNRFVGKQQG